MSIYCAKKPLIKYIIMYGMTITLIACGGGENGLGNNGDTDSGVTVVGSENAGNESGSDGGATNNGAVNADNADASVLTISATNPADYNWTTLASGTDVYIDRNYTYSTIPSAYVNFKVLQTANNDKTSTGDVFISFEIDQSSTIYVAHVTDGNSRPSWLSSWTSTGDSILTTDRRLFIYKKDFSAGTVTLGGNDGAASMYTVVIATSGSSAGGTGGSTSGSSSSGTNGSTSGSSAGGTNDSTSGSSTNGVGSNDIQIVILWDQNPTPIIGYKIYRGSSPESASTLLSDILITSKNFISEKPSVTYDATNELGLKTGDDICFRIKAYNLAGMADFSSANCVTI